MKKSHELDVNNYANLAAEKVGFIGEIKFQTLSRWFEKAGTYEILDFTPYEKPSFTFNHWRYREDDTPTGIDLGVYTIRITESKFYNGKTIRVKVSAFLTDDSLYIWNYNVDTGKSLKAYRFPFVNC